jgi:hypothetical protein
MHLDVSTQASGLLIARFSSSQLHDVGKTAISDAILNKPSKLTPEEFEIMKTHVDLGIRVIEKNTAEHAFLRHAKIFAATHHEKWDGSGYPLGLSGENIPLEGRLMAIADVYDVPISQCPYKPALEAEKPKTSPLRRAEPTSSRFWWRSFARSPTVLPESGAEDRRLSARYTRFVVCDQSSVVRGSSDHRLQTTKAAPASALIPDSCLLLPKIRFFRGWRVIT